MRIADEASAWHRDLGEPSASKIGILNLAQNLAGLVTGPIVSIVAEKYGRKWCFRAYSVLLCLFALTACLAGVVGHHSYGVYAASKALVLGLWTWQTQFT